MDALRGALAEKCVSTLIRGSFPGEKRKDPLFRLSKLLPSLSAHSRQFQPINRCTSEVPAQLPVRMSSAAPSPSNVSKPSGNCVVCGKKTQLRCGECLREGTTEQWFCGIEHKKLIWSLHKRFCGVRSNPFQWPGLSSEEYNEYIRNTAFCASADGFDIEGKHKAEWDALQYSKDPPKGERVPARLNEPIVKLRQTIFDVTLDDLHDSINPEDPEMACYSKEMQSTCIFVAHCTQNPVDAAIVVQERILPGLASSPERWGTWWTAFQHKFITYHAVRQVFAAGDRSEQMANYMEHCAKELMRFCREKVSVTHPREAKIVIEAIAAGSGASKS
ncbi:hypothetical protein JCM3765_002556 [Sporobolomyces pararoseus]